MKLNHVRTITLSLIVLVISLIASFYLVLIIFFPALFIVPEYVDLSEIKGVNPSIYEEYYSKAGSFLFPKNHTLVIDEKKRAILESSDKKSSIVVVIDEVESIVLDIKGFSGYNLRGEYLYSKKPSLLYERAKSILFSRRRKYFNSQYKIYNFEINNEQGFIILRKGKHGDKTEIELFDKKDNSIERLIAFDNHDYEITLEMIKTILSSANWNIEK